MTDDARDDATKLQRRFGLNLRAARLQQNLTQEELAEIAGQHRVSVQRIEGGLANVTVLTMASLARAVSKSVEDLLTANPEAVTDLDAVGSHAGPVSGQLAIELPETDAFIAARVVAERLGRPIPLFDTITRTVVGVAGQNKKRPG